MKSHTYSIVLALRHQIDLILNLHEPIRLKKIWIEDTKENYRYCYIHLTAFLLFFVIAGKLPRNNGVKWRGNSGLSDGSDATDVKGGLVGGYYDAGDNIKFHFPMAFSMTMLSWSVIEYSAKYKAVGEYDHARELIKWGTDYLLRTFNSSASAIGHVYAQVTNNQKFQTLKFSLQKINYFVVCYHLFDLVMRAIGGSCKDQRHRTGRPLLLEPAGGHGLQAPLHFGHLRSGPRR
jgi:hypothetical protein